MWASSDRVEAPAAGPARVRPSSRRRRAPTRTGQETTEDEQHGHGREQADDRDADERLDGGVEVDGTDPPGASAAGARGRPESSRSVAAGDRRCYPPARSARSSRPPMAKRSRLAGRPGQRRPLQRTSTPAPCRVDARGPPPPTSITPEEEARAAELEAQIVAEEQAATEARSARTRGRSPDGEVVVSSGTIAARASDEYRYVSRDLRRIAVVGGFLIAVMVVLEILVNALHLVHALAAPDPSRRPGSTAGLSCVETSSTARARWAHTGKAGRDGASGNDCRSAVRAWRRRRAPPSWPSASAAVAVAIADQADRNALASRRSPPSPSRPARLPSAARAPVGQRPRPRSSQRSSRDNRLSDANTNTVAARESSAARDRYHRARGRTPAPKT